MKFDQIKGCETKLKNNLFKTFNGKIKVMRPILLHFRMHRYCEKLTAVSDTLKIL